MAEGARLCAGYVLTGGQSSRMGQDKALLSFGGQPLAAWMAELVKRVCGGVTLVGGRAKYAALGLAVIEDLFPNQGPLGGIHAALADSGSPFSLIVGCDMPYLSVEFLGQLIEIARTAGADAVVPEWEALQREPLCAVYTPACLRPAEEALRKGEGKIGRLLERVRVRRVSRAEWQPYDTHGKLFCNLNTAEDYRTAVTSDKQKSGVSSQKKDRGSEILF